MGWSIEIVRGELDKVFKNLGVNYEIQHPDTIFPSVYIIYDKDLPIATMAYIAKMFPENVYLDFKKTSFPVGQELGQEPGQKQ